MNYTFFYSSKNRANHFLIFFLIFLIIASVYIFLSNSKANNVSIIGVLPIVVCIVLLAVNLKRVFAKTKEGIYLTSEGIVIKTSYITYFAEWQNINSFRSFEVMSQPLIGIDLFDNDRYLQNLKPLLRKISKTSIEKYGTPISIPINLYNVSKIELLSELNYQLEVYRKK